MDKNGGRGVGKKSTLVHSGGRGGGVSKKALRQNPSTYKSLRRKKPLAKSLQRKIPPSKMPPHLNTSQQNTSRHNATQQNTYNLEISMYKWNIAKILMQLCTASTLTNCCDGSQKVQKSRRVVIFGVGGGHNLHTYWDRVTARDSNEWVAKAQDVSWFFCKYLPWYF